MTTSINDLVGSLTEKEQELKSKYEAKLEELQSWTGDWDGKKYNTQAYYQIKQSDWDNACVFALARTIQNIRDGIKDIYQGGFENAIEGDILGMLSEIIIAQAFGVDYDRNIKFKNSPKYDVKVEERTIDVKACLRRNVNAHYVVIHEGKKIGDSDEYFFTRLLSNTTLNLHGWLPEEVLIREKNKRDGKTGYWYESSKLYKFFHKEA